MLEKFQNQTLEKIQELRLKPKPKWVFQTKEILVWSVFVLSTIFGGIAFALFLHLLRKDFIPVARYLKTHEYLIYFPFFWIFFLGLFITLAIVYWKKSDSGYKQKPINIFFISVISSIIIGCFVFLSQMSEPIYNATHKIPGPFQLEKMQNKIWLMPGNNRIGGEIVSDLDGNHFEIQNFCQKNIREIYTNKLPAEQFFLIKKGNQVRIITEQDLDDMEKVQALAILKWNKPLAKGENCKKK